MKDLQVKVRRFSQECGIENPPHINALDTMAELGEVVAEMIKSAKYGKENFRRTEQLESEMGDVLYSSLH